MPLIIRPETPADFSAIHMVNAQALRPQEAQLVDDLRAAGMRPWISLVYV